MHVLFLHQAFPAQFGRLGLELHKRYGWKCSFLIENLSNCPSPTVEMLQRLEIQQLPLSEEFRKERLTPWPQAYGRHLQLCQAVFEAVRARPDLRPDLVVGHDGLGPALFLPELLSCPIVNYCEYYFSPRRRDISYRIDLPPAEPAEFYPRSINAATLINLAAFSWGYSPTHWQRQSFPKHFLHKIEVHFDGLDTELYKPPPAPPQTGGGRGGPRTFAGRSIPADHRLVTFVARGLESMRGFDLFMRLAQRIAEERSDVLFAVVGQDRSYYGWDRLHTGQSSFKNWVLNRNNYDLSRFIFVEHLQPDQLADLLRMSDLHVYLTVPFVLSWSLFNSLASGCVVLAGDVPPVREVVTPGVNGLTESLFDTDRQVDTALRVLADPAAFRPLAEAGRRLIVEKYSLEVAIPELRDFFERAASAS